MEYINHSNFKNEIQYSNIEEHLDDSGNQIYMSKEELAIKDIKTLDMQKGTR